ncbi:hypothetical protein H4S06_000234, partial [Coemansia sp. BCRC 34490]
MSAAAIASPDSGNEGALLQALGECLFRLDAGNYSGSLAALDRYSRPQSQGHENDNDDDYVEHEAVRSFDDRYSDASSNTGSFADEFRDASSSPTWIGDNEAEEPHMPHQFTVSDVFGKLRQLVHREQSRHSASFDSHAAAAQQPATPNWWSTFMPDNAQAAPANWSPPAMVIPPRHGPSNSEPAYLAPPTLSSGDARFPMPSSPALAVVSSTGEQVCVECIRACESVADAV